MAAQLASSIRYYDTRRKLCIVCDDPGKLGENIALFDHVVVIPREFEHLRGTEIHLYLNNWSPYERTIYVDSDCLASSPRLLTIWDTLSEYNVTFPGIARESGTWRGVEIAELRRKIETSYIVQLNGGVFYFNKTAESADFFSMAQRLFLDRRTEISMPHKKGGGYSNELIWACALAISGTRILPLEEHMNISTLNIESYAIDIDTPEITVRKSAAEFKPIFTHFIGLGGQKTPVQNQLYREFYAALRANSRLGATAFLQFPASDQEQILVNKPQPTPASQPTSEQQRGSNNRLRKNLEPDNAFVPFEQLGRIIPPYNPTYEFGKRFIDSYHASLGPDVERGSVDIGVKGSLWSADGFKLYELAHFADGDILELGSGHGQSTTILANALKNRPSAGKGHSVDNSDSALRWAGEALEKNSLSQFFEFHLGEGTDVVRRFSEEGRQFGFAFVDHSHEYGHVKEVCELLPLVLLPGSFVLFHDYNDPRNRKPERTDYGVFQGVEQGLDLKKFSFVGVFGCAGLYQMKT